MAVVFFFLPWLSISSDPVEALRLPSIHCVSEPGAGDVTSGNLTGLDMANTYGQLTYKTNGGYYGDLKCTDMDSAWYLYWTPVLGILSGVLTGVLALVGKSILILPTESRLTTFYQRIHFLYFGLGLVGLLIHLYVYFDFWILNLESGVTGADVYNVEPLMAYWVSTLGWFLVLIAAVGLYFVADSEKSLQITVDEEVVTGIESQDEAS